MNGHLVGSGAAAGVCYHPVVSPAPTATAVAVAASLIVLAACLGVLRYSGWAEMLGPPFHQPAGRLCYVSVACIRPALARMRR